MNLLTYPVSQISLHELIESNDDSIIIHVRNLPGIAVPILSSYII